MVRNFVRPSEPGPSLPVDDMVLEAHYALLHHYEVTSEAWFAVYGSYAALISLEPPGWTAEMSVRTGASALKRFCTMKCPTTIQDYIPWVWIGVWLSMHTHCNNGLSAAPVRRYMVSHLGRLGDRGKVFAAHPTMVHTVALDIYDSLLRGDIPALDLPEARSIPHSFLGVCSPLVHMVYELCLINSAAVAPAADDQAYLPPSKNTTLHELESRVNAWEPALHPAVAKALTEAEVSQAILQARAQKKMVLLFMHRLTHPVGIEDTVAASLAASIFSDLYQARPTRELPMAWVTLPFVLAATEIQSPEERTKALNHVSLFVDGLSRTGRGLTKVFLENTWRLRDYGAHVKWADLMRQVAEIQLNYVGAWRVPQDDGE